MGVALISCLRKLLEFLKTVGFFSPWHLPEKNRVHYKDEQRVIDQNCKIYVGGDVGCAMMWLLGYA